MAGKTKPTAKNPDRNFGAEALEFHSQGRPGKLEITPTKPLTTQRDLSLAYSPGVAEPCLRIAEDPNKAYDYTGPGQPGGHCLQTGDGRQGRAVQALCRCGRL